MNIRFSRARKNSRRHNPFLKFFRDDANAADRERRWSRMRKFLSYYRPHLPLLLADLLCAILVAGTAVALPLCANIVTSRLLALPDAPQAFAHILAMGGVMLAVLAVQIVAIFFVDYRGHVMGARIEATVRQELFEHCQKLSFSFYDRQRTGQLMSRITNDSLWLGELFHHGPEDLSIAVLKYGGAMLVLFFIDPPLAALILLLTPAAVA
ncbi:ABC transporter transmembrane domain-containing protein, partial [Rhizobium ruizarguesonis]